MVTEFEFLEYINSTGIPYKERGDELKMEYCPYCESAQKKKPYDHFAFNRKKMVFNCVKCGAKGNLYRFKLDRGDVKPITKAREIVYKKPVPDTSITDGKDAAYQWYEKERGICADTLKSYQVGFMRREGKPIIVYQYFDENNVLVNRKYRSPDKKIIWTEKDAEKAYYGLQYVNFGDDTLYVCEGEDDCHALVQMGLHNVVSVPFGATSYTPAMDRVNKRFKKIYLIFDNDDRGQDGARAFAEKAGMTRCMNVVLPYKDARECLLEGLDVFDIAGEINKAKMFRHENILKAGDVKIEFSRSIFESKKIFGHMTQVEAFNRTLGGIRTGELSIVIGHTGSGKSTFSYNVAAWMEAVGVPTMVFPFENRLESVLRKFVEIYSRECIYDYDYREKKYVLSKTKEWIDAQIDILNQKDLYFLNKKHRSNHGYFDIRLVENIVEYAVKFYNVKFIVMDHLHYFLKLSNARNPHLVIEESMRMIKQWTDDYDCHIMLNVHPHMTEDSRSGTPVKLGINASKGSSGISQECDNYMVIERPEKGKDGNDKMAARLRIEKNREMGQTGEVMFSVLKNRNTFVDYDNTSQEKLALPSKEAACKDTDF